MSVPGPDEFGAVDHAGLQAHQNFRRRRGLRRDAKPAVNLAAEPERAQLEAAHIGKALHLAAKPAAHADAGIAAHERLHAEWRIELVPQRLPAAGIDPGDMLARRQPERHRGEKCRRRHLALPVKRRSVADIGNTVADGIQHLESGHHFAGGIDGDIELAARQRAHALGDALGRHAGPRQPLRPGGDHAPFLCLRARNRRCRNECRPACSLLR